LTLFSLALPLTLLFYLWGRGLSLAAALETLFGWLPRAWQPPASLRLVRSLRDGETYLHGVLRRHPRLLVTGLLVSVGHWCLLLADFWLATRLVGMELTPDQWIGFVVAARIAILLPIPAAQRLGLNPALALGLVLLFRVRDIALALWGLWLARREMNDHARPLSMPLGALADEDKYGR